MNKQIVRFVVDEDLDIENHLIGLWSYQKKLHSLVPASNARYETLAKLSPAQRKRFVAKELAWRYAPAKKKLLVAMAKDMNAAWAKIEKRFIKGIEKIHGGHPFPFRSVKGVLSSADRFGYRIEEHWFATSMFRNTYSGTDTAMHELMHFMFLTYYLKPCQDAGLSEDQIWDIKESFTTLLNIEFDDIRFNWDAGYPEHKELRGIIKKAWLKHRNFEKVLQIAIENIGTVKRGEVAPPLTHP